MTTNTVVCHANGGFVSIANTFVSVAIGSNLVVATHARTHSPHTRTRSCMLVRRAATDSGPVGLAGVGEQRVVLAPVVVQRYRPWHTAELGALNNSHGSDTLCTVAPEDEATVLSVAVSLSSNKSMTVVVVMLPPKAALASTAWRFMHPACVSHRATRCTSTVLMLTASTWVGGVPDPPTVEITAKASAALQINGIAPLRRGGETHVSSIQHSC
jgi:hypothetical protein